ncbi:TPA: hypothetical protein MW136_002329 [Acinetobacter baumannii]|nr:hypothetical protein [Acinetobacter baumannii]
MAGIVGIGMGGMFMQEYAIKIQKLNGSEENYLLSKMVKKDTGNISH